MLEVDAHDIRSVRLRISKYLYRFRREFPEHADRLILPDEDTHVIDSLAQYFLFNRLASTALYPEEEYDEDSVVSRLFEHWNANHTYPCKNKKHCTDDEGSLYFERYCLNSIRDYIEGLISIRFTPIKYRLFQVEISATKITIFVYGDWRAKEWCKQQGIHYEI